LKKHGVLLDLLTKHKSLFKTLDKHEKIIMEYLEKKCRKDSTLLNFLKTKIMGTYFTSEDFDYRQYLLGELKNLYRDKKYYKEALKVSEQIADEIKEAANIEQPLLFLSRLLFVVKLIYRWYDHARKALNYHYAYLQH